MRLFPIAATLCLLMAPACKSEDTGGDSSVEDTADTGDSSPPDYFPAIGFTFVYYLGVRGGQLADWAEDGDEYYPQLVWTFFDDAYLDLMVPGLSTEERQQIEDEHTCKAWFALASTSSDRTPEAWYSWDLTLEMRTNRCLLDPEIFAGGAEEVVAGDAWGLDLLPIDQDYFDSLGAGWEEEQPYLLGLDTWLNEQSLDQLSFSHESLALGWALDEDGVVDRDQPLTPEAMATRPDGYFWSFTLLTWTY